MLTTVVVNAMYDFSAEVIMPKFIEGKVIHDPAVNNVSASDRNLNVKVTVKLGDYSAASNPELLYYFDDDKDNVTTVSLETEVYKNQPF